jgi:hypothetical protein
LPHLLSPLCSAPPTPHPLPPLRGDEELEKQLAAQLDKAAADLVQEFQSGMEEVMQNLAAAQDAFEDLSGEARKAGEGEGGKGGGGGMVKVKDGGRGARGGAGLPG